MEENQGKVELQSRLAGLRLVSKGMWVAATAMALLALAAVLMDFSEVWLLPSLVVALVAFGLDRRAAMWARELGRATEDGHATPFVLPSKWPLRLIPLGLTSLIFSEYQQPLIGYLGLFWRDGFDGGLGANAVKVLLTAVWLLLVLGVWHYCVHLARLLGDGFLLRLDRFGIQGGGRLFVPWREVEGVDVFEGEKGQILLRLNVPSYRPTGRDKLLALINGPFFLLLDRAGVINIECSGGGLSAAELQVEVQRWVGGGRGGHQPLEGANELPVEDGIDRGALELAEVALHEANRRLIAAAAQPKSFAYREAIMDVDKARAARDSIKSGARR